jgi:hypothetical protein
VLFEAAGFALLAAVSPAALLVMAVFLGSANPRVTALMYVAGAIVMTVATAIALLFVLRAVGLNQPRHHEPRYGLRFGLGVLSLAAGAYMTARPRRAPAVSGQRAENQGKAKRPGLIARLTASPGPLTAFVAGLLLFAPSATFIAAVQVIATANEGVPITIAAILVVVVITALIVWLPLLGYLAYPEATTRALRTANDRLRAHGRTLVTGALWVAGAALVVNGSLGLWH